MFKIYIKSSRTQSSSIYLKRKFKNILKISFHLNFISNSIPHSAEKTVCVEYKDDSVYAVCGKNKWNAAKIKT